MYFCIPLVRTPGIEEQHNNNDNDDDNNHINHFIIPTNAHNVKNVEL